MDAQRFDDLTQQVTSLISRRRFGVVLGALGLATSLLPSSGGEAKKRKRRKKKKSSGGSGGGGGCTPDCAGKACGASDGCTGTCNQGSCPVNQTCQGGQCVPVSGCNPPCPSDRPCSGGKCTCSEDRQCARDRDPDGFQCLNSVTNPFCGCRKQRPTDEYPRVCVGGEPCSSCCTDQECRARVPELPDIVCTSLPVNTLGGRCCCVPQGGLCGGNNQCCGGGCVGNACGCLGPGQNCGAHETCCSNQCGTQANPFKCM